MSIMVTSKAGTLSQFSLKACFLLEKNDLGGGMTSAAPPKIMHLGGEEM
jgi:hypothetical protein